MFGAWVPGLGWGWGVTNILEMMVGEAPGGPPADNFKSLAACTLQPAFRDRSYLWGCVGALEGFHADGFKVICSPLVRLAAFSLVGDMGAFLQMISNVYAAPRRWLKLEKEAQVQELIPDLDRDAQI